MDFLYNKSTQQIEVMELGFISETYHVGRFIGKPGLENWLEKKTSFYVFKNLENLKSPHFKALSF